MLGYTLSRIEHFGIRTEAASRPPVPDHVQVTEQMRLALAPQFDLETRGEVEVKGREQLPACLAVDSKKASGVTARLKIRFGCDVSRGRSAPVPGRSHVNIFAALDVSMSAVVPTLLRPGTGALRERLFKQALRANEFIRQS